MEEKLKIQDRRFYPLMASADDTNDSQAEAEIVAVWDKFDTLPDEKKRLLLSYEVAEKLFLAEKGLHLSEKTTNKMAVSVRQLLFGEIRVEEVESSLGREINAYIQSQILTLQIPPDSAEGEEEEIFDVESDTGLTVSLIKLQILQALSQYPNLGNQTISGERIRIKSQPEPVRGSLYNWIKYYRDELGIGQHSTVERGQFLFRSENGKALGTLERERVNLILKSLEENLPLEIDTERQEIIFPPISVETASPVAVPSPVLTPRREPVVERVVPPAVPVPLPPVVEVPKSQAPARLDAQPFVPKPAPSKPAEPVSMASKFQPSASPYQKISIPPQPLSPERLASSNSGIDVSQMAEKLKREPKPEWIKGVFTKDSIPETAPIAPAVGSMSFSFNHALPAEQEKRQTPLPVVESIPEPREPQPQPQVQPVVVPQVQVAEKNVSPAPARGSSQFHIRPVSRRDP